MYCSKCGSFLPEGVTNCPNCNEPVRSATYNNDGTYYTPPQHNEEQNTYYQNPTENNYQPNEQTYQSNGQYNYQYNAPQFNEAQLKNTLANSTSLGILAIILGIFVSRLVGIICGAIGLGKANSVPDMISPEIDKEKAKAKKLNILGIVLPIVLGILAIIIIIIAALCFGYASEYGYY